LIHLHFVSFSLDIHFIHAKPKVPSGTKVYPILLLHGWPGSVREFYELIPKLIAKSADKDFVFEVIAPSLPGYGFSEAASKVKLSTTEIAIIMRNLMIRLGFQQFYIQGGDWGSFIGNDLVTVFPENVLGIQFFRN
jgi:juvenile hormone epoxide hydrolase